MSDNIWQRRVIKRIGEVLAGVEDEYDWQPLASFIGEAIVQELAAEDAEREGHLKRLSRQWADEMGGDAERDTLSVVDGVIRPPQHECPQDVGVAANCSTCECVPYEKQCAYHSDARLRPPETPAPSLPPLDAELVEECARAYDDAPWVTDGESREQDIASMRAALTHYRERVERPLREALERERMRLAECGVVASGGPSIVDAYRSASLEAVVKLRAEANRLRAELNQYDERGHDAQIEIDRLRGELADVRASHDRLIDVVAQESYACGIGDTMTPEERVRQMRHHFDRAVLCDLVPVAGEK